MLPILTPIGAHLPAFKENQYIVHYIFIWKEIFLLFSKEGNKDSVLLGHTKLLCWDPKPWNLIFSHIFLSTNLTQIRCQPRMRAHLSHCCQQYYIRAMTDSPTNNSENMRFMLAMANLWLKVCICVWTDIWTLLESIQITTKGMFIELF